MVVGFFDIMYHILEQYLPSEDDNASVYISEGLMRSFMHSSRIAVKNTHDYEARSNIMWTENIGIEHVNRQDKISGLDGSHDRSGVGAYTNATHGMTLSAVSLAYYRTIMNAGLKNFGRFAVNVWGINLEGKSDRS